MIESRVNKVKAVNDCQWIVARNISESIEIPFSPRISSYAIGQYEFDLGLFFVTFRESLFKWKKSSSSPIVVIQELFEVSVEINLSKAPVS